MKYKRTDGHPTDSTIGAAKSIKVENIEGQHEDNMILAYLKEGESIWRVLTYLRVKDGFWMQKNWIEDELIDDDFEQVVERCLEDAKKGYNQRRKTYG